jgi:hypothetical protein
MLHNLVSTDVAEHQLGVSGTVSAVHVDSSLVSWGSVCFAQWDVAWCGGACCHKQVADQEYGRKGKPVEEQWEHYHVGQAACINRASVIVSAWFLCHVDINEVMRPAGLMIVVVLQLVVVVVVTHNMHWIVIDFMDVLMLCLWQPKIAFTSLATVCSMTSCFGSFAGCGVALSVGNSCGQLSLGGFDLALLCFVTVRRIISEDYDPWRDQLVVPEGSRTRDVWGKR